MASSSRREASSPALSTRSVVLADRSPTIGMPGERYHVRWDTRKKEERAGRAELGALICASHVCVSRPEPCASGVPCTARIHRGVLENVRILHANPLPRQTAAAGMGQRLVRVFDPQHFGAEASGLFARL